MSQRDLFTEAPPLEPPTLRERFEIYHAENPHIYAALCRFADQALRAGRTRIGIAMIFERMRWYSTIEAADRDDGFKLNNSYRAFYARLWMHEHPAHDGFFETREQRHAE